MTGRLPFDPSRVAGPKRAKTAAPDRPMTVGELSGKINSALARLGPSVCVIGEVSNASTRTHRYFALKDADATVSCVTFANVLRRLSTVPEDGQRVVVEGRLDYYAPSGRVSIVVTSVKPAGLGPLDEAYRKLAAELRELGWFDESRKQAIPSFCRRIAVVTSAGGAAIRDILETARQRCPAVDWLVVDVPVQGDRAAPAVTHAIDSLDQSAETLGIDAILVTRGGGSIEDLWAFNERTVAEAIRRCRLPIVAAIGHESDTSIAELVADWRCATPTQAAVRLTPDNASLREQVGTLQRRLNASLDRRAAVARERVRGAAFRLNAAGRERVTRRRSEAVDRLAQRLTSGVRRRLNTADRRWNETARRLDRSRPAAVFARRRSRLDLLASRWSGLVRGALAEPRRRFEAERLPMRLASAAVRRLDEERRRLDALDRELHAVGPRRVLERGFSITTTESGEVIRQAEQAPSGTVVRTRLAIGGLVSRVVGEADDAAAEPSKPAVPLAKPPPRRRPSRRSVRGAADPSQLDLFGGSG